VKPAKLSEAQTCALRYQRCMPGLIRLYKVVAQHYLAFFEHMA